ncbi:hypothetical protein KUF83_30460 [Streptomyces sp. BV286]|uniref:hypothetical protein n=1 Tax=Streptomyces sp. BV286 TaxID=2849672 RepID=UPI001C2E3BAA|nr:hypothetical protein [Streptomyces sp. BV286]MBV1940860.1 hypothetical protein [Streptomyces sp. BV286]
MSGNEHAHGPDEVGSGGVPLDERFAHLGHIEIAAEMYVSMTPVPNTMPVPADADEWIAAFGRVAADGKTRVDLDPQGNSSRWVLRPDETGDRP